MRALLIVLLDPGLDDLSRLLHGAEPPPVQAAVAEDAVEALVPAVLPRAAVASLLKMRPVDVLGSNALTGACNEEQALHRYADHRDLERGRGRGKRPRSLPASQRQRAEFLPLEAEVRWHGGLRGQAATRA